VVVVVHEAVDEKSIVEKGVFHTMIVVDDVVVAHSDYGTDAIVVDDDDAVVVDENFSRMIDHQTIHLLVAVQVSLLHPLPEHGIHY
jgi:hypothetical protein